MRKKRRGRRTTSLIFAGDNHDTRIFGKSFRKLSPPREFVMFIQELQPTERKRDDGDRFIYFFVRLVRLVLIILL